MKQVGFSLLELLIALLIIGILAAAVIPHYSHSTLRAEQTLAKTALLNLSVELHQYYEEHHSYENASLELFGIKNDIEKSDYELKIVNIDSESFTIAAIPKKARSEDICGTFMIDQNGRKWVSHRDGTHLCW